MSRTFRKPSHRLYDSSIKKVKDNSRTKHARSCENNGGCPYCKSNKLYKNNKKIINIKILLENE